MDLYHLRFYGIVYTCSCATSFSFDLDLGFSRSDLKMLYFRNGRADWHWTNGMWVERTLHPLCHFQHSPHPWPCPWIFEVKFWQCCISGMGGQIDMELKGCELIGSYTHFVTFNFDLNHDLDHGFWRSNFEKVVSQELDGWLTWNERDVSRQNVKTHVVTSNFYLTHDLDLGFSR